MKFRFEVLIDASLETIWKIIDDQDGPGIPIIETVTERREPHFMAGTCETPTGGAVVVSTGLQYIKHGSENEKAGNRRGASQPDANAERDEEIVQLDADGLPRKEIAYRYGLSTQRMSQILSKKKC